MTTSRRRFVLASAGLAAAGLTAVPPRPAHAEPRPTAPSSENRGADRFAALEAEFGLRLAVHARDHRSGRAVSWRADEAIPLCSVFKALAVAAVLRGDLLVPDPQVLGRSAPIPPAAVVPNSPTVTAALAASRHPTVEELCVGALQLSDNTAANELLARIGGPEAITTLARRLGDRHTRLDRWEPELNSAEPGRLTDTTTPRAIAGTLTELLLGRALRRPQRDRLTTWMLGNRTSDARLRAALPPRWRLADKTGGGSYAVNNDVGVAYGPGGRTITLAVMSRSDDPTAVTDDALIEQAGRVCFDLLV